MATGALNVSYSDGSDPYFRRGGRMLLANLLADMLYVVVDPRIRIATGAR